MNSKLIQFFSLLTLVAVFAGAASRPDVASASLRILSLEQATSQPTGPINSRELEAFLDDLLAAEIAEKYIPGAVLAWVRRYWSLGGRISYTLLATLALLLTWALAYWNLLQV